MSKTIFSCLMLVGASTAIADTDPGTPGANAAPTPKKNLPAPKSDHDTAPPVASPAVALPPEGVVEQAGVGGTTGYGRAGVLELGGSAGLVMSSGITDLNIAPSIGWFLADNLELSGILGVTHVKASNDSATVWQALIEPSYHLPINRSVFGFMGMGFGAAYEQKLGAGLAVAPRIGMNLLVGRSGVLSPSLSYEYITHNTMVQDNVTLVAITSALRVNVGYTAMW